MFTTMMLCSHYITTLSFPGRRLSLITLCSSSSTIESASIITAGLIGVSPPAPATKNKKRGENEMYQRTKSKLTQTNLKTSLSWNIWLCSAPISDRNTRLFIINLFNSTTVSLICLFEKRTDSCHNFHNPKLTYVSCCPLSLNR